MAFLDVLKGISGTFEINRVVGAFGATAYVLGANAFVAYDVIWKGSHFDVTAYCLAFPSGLAVAVGAIAGAVAIKDRNVAVAQTVQNTGSMPGKAANSPTDAPQDVNVVNQTDHPVPVETKKGK